MYLVMVIMLILNPTNNSMAEELSRFLTAKKVLSVEGKFEILKLLDSRT